MTARVHEHRVTLLPRRRRSVLMLSCAVAAIALAGSQQARAQAFQGTETVVGGTAVRNITSPTTETITIASPTATINWSPTDSQGAGTIDFLPVGNTATFTNDPQSTSDFTVLNRILPIDPSRPVALNGHVISQLQDLSQNVTTGGSVWFYSPGGLVVGSSAVFDVGGLVLTANDPVSLTAGTGSFSSHFVTNAASNATVRVNAGAQINALNESSYVALIAPRVEQSGTIRVNGSAALVAAQDVTMTLNQGLFDIQVDVGTGDAEGIVHDGSTTGPASSASGDNHRIYMVAVPKNQALTTLLTGTAGFDAATSASVENGLIVLSAGYSVNSVGGDNPGDSLFGAIADDGAQPVSPTPANFHIIGGHYTSDLIGRASQNIFASGQSQSTAFDGDVTLIGASAAHINARNGQTITVGGNATVTNGMSDLYHDRSGVGGQVLLNAEAGSVLTIAGNANADASVRGGANAGATGGNATVSAGGGTVDIAGNLDVQANGYGGATGTGQAGGAGTGGSALVVAGTGGTLHVAGDASVTASALSGINQAGTTAAASTGGTATLHANGGDVAIDGSALVTANALGGASFAGGATGAATGGTADVASFSGASLTVGGNISATATAQGGVASTSADTDGGNAQGGSVSVNANGGDIAAANITTDANGFGAQGVGSGDGGSGHGGHVNVFAIGGSLSTPGSIALTASGTGGDGAIGGEGSGGLGEIYAQDGSIAFATGAVSTNGSGGDGETGGGRGLGGIPTVVGDDVAPDLGSFVSARNGSITGNTLLVASVASGGSAVAGNGGDALGGLAEITALNGAGASLITVSNASVIADAVGGAGGSGGNGGIGQAGQVDLLARAVNGALDVETAQLEAIGVGGQGGDGLTGGRGGAGYGGFTNFGTSSGTATTTARDGVANLGTVTVSLSGFGGGGGSGGAGGVGGDGIGGSGTLLARGSEVNADVVVIAADGAGGIGGFLDNSDSRASAGIGIGGFAGVLATNFFEGTAPATVNVGTFSASASGVALLGTGVTQAGEVSIDVQNSSATFGSVDMTAAGAQERNYSGVDGFGDAFTLTAAPASISALNGTVHVTGTANVTTGSNLLVQALAGGNIDVDGSLILASTAAAGDASSIVAANGGTIDVGGALSATSATLLRVAAEGSGQLSAATMTLASSGDGIAVESVDGGAIDVAGLLSATATSSAGEIAVSALSTTQAPPGAAPITAGSLSLTSAGDLTVGNVDVGGVADLVYGDDLDIGDLSAGNLIRARLAAQLDPDAGAHELLISGLVSAPSISLESGTIDIASDASLGEPGVTDTLELIARSFGDPIIIGGPDQTGDAEGQYHLTQATAGRIEANTVRFRGTSNSSAAPQIIVRDLTIQGTQGGGAGTVELTTEGSVRVEGDLSYIDAAASDALRITAGQRLEVITPDGSIRMVDSDGALSGILTLQSPNVVVTDAALAQQLAQNPNFSGRNQALATNNGAVNQAGFLQAGGIRLLTSGNIFIQNTGTATEFAGMTVGGQGLLVGRFAATTNPDGLQTFSFTGTLTTADDVLRFDFTITAESEIILRTYSYAGGTNGEGEAIPAGGFDPILALFDAAGVLIDQNDDGGSNVPADPTTGSHYDTFLQTLLPAGNYTVTVMAFSNFANGPNLSDGFEGGGSFDDRTQNFAFDVIGADTVTGPGGNTPITFIGFGRRANADGTFTTGNAFFNAADFGTDNGVQYVQGSTFNGCAVGGSCAVTPPPPPPPPDPEPEIPFPTGTNSGGVVLGPIDVVTSDGDPGGSDADDAAGPAVTTSLALISGSTGQEGAVLDEAITSGGDTSQWIKDDEECRSDDRDAVCQPEGPVR